MTSVFLLVGSDNPPSLQLFQACLVVRRCRTKLLKITNKGEAVLRPALTTVCNLFNLVPREKGQKEHGAVPIEWIFLFKVLTRTLFELPLFQTPQGSRTPIHYSVEPAPGAHRACFVRSVVMLGIDQVTVVFCLSFKVAFDSGNMQLASTDSGGGQAWPAEGSSFIPSGRDSRRQRRTSSQAQSWTPFWDHTAGSG